jgi:hypothetical protein
MWGLFLPLTMLSFSMTYWCSRETRILVISFFTIPPPTLAQRMLWPTPAWPKQSVFSTISLVCQSQATSPSHCGQHETVEFHPDTTIVIGLQIRMSDSCAKMDQMPTFWECATEQAAKELLSWEGANNKKKKVCYFLLSYNLEAQKVAKEWFGDNNFWRDDLNQVISERLGQYSTAQYAL